MRMMAVGAFIRGRDMGSVVGDMQVRVKTMTLPPGYLVTWSGEFENQQRAMRRLVFIVPVSVFLIFILLFDAFKSVRSSLLILLNVPFALIGGTGAVWIRAKEQPGMVKLTATHPYLGAQQLQFELAPAPSEIA